MARHIDPRPVKKLREECPGVTIETLIPDFRGKEELIGIIVKEKPDIISHNIETVSRLTPQVRSVATYECSLSVIKSVADVGVRSKSGIMLGLGETRDEILETMDDLRRVGCEVLTIGQYLQPPLEHYPVKEYIHPTVFDEYRQIGLSKGFLHVESGPFVRSSYHAHKHVQP